MRLGPHALANSAHTLLGLEGDAQPQPGTIKLRCRALFLRRSPSRALSALHSRLGERVVDAGRHWGVCRRLSV